jgi:multiple sugar transport system ATP-binding protein
VAGVDLQGITKSFGSTRVLEGIDLAVGDGEFMTLVGPSGCGKSTLIRIIAGLEPQDGGTLAIGGAPVDHLRAHERRVAMVFQSYALYPHMTVGANIGLPLAMQRLSLVERLPLLRLFSTRRRAIMRGIDAEVRGVAAQLHLEHLLERRPSQLSGGQRQRVALGRAMVRHPDVFLMDEPLSNLDAKLRVHMRSELAELHKRLGTTFIYVTHDQVEAMTMSDRVAMMDAGRILQLGTPSELYAHPADIKVAAFIGSPSINLLPGRVAASGAVEIFGRELAIASPLPAGSQVTVGVRPEAIAVEPWRGPRSDAALPARLRRRENLGSEFILHFDVLATDAPGLVARAPATLSLADGDEVALTVQAAACHLFGETGRRLEARTAPGEPASSPLRPLPVLA